MTKQVWFKIFTFVMPFVLMSCTMPSNLVQTEASRVYYHNSTTEVTMNPNSLKHEQTSPADATYTILETDISEQELLSRATLPVLWPTYLPAGFSFQRAGVFALNPKQTENTDNFVLHFGSGKDQWLMIQRMTDLQGVSLKNFQAIGQASRRTARGADCDPPRRCHR